MKTLREYQADNYPWSLENCTDEENEEYNAKLDPSHLPPDIAQRDYRKGKYRFFKRVWKENLTQEERYEYLLLKAASSLDTIKGCCIFFTVIAVIGLVAGLIIAS
ncbi:MAG: hypothetical protein KH354_03530 [Clostridiales bacterium]|nr:hypothetical protein [Clostridiales bacterium]